MKVLKTLEAALRDLRGGRGDDRPRQVTALERGLRAASSEGERDLVRAELATLRGGGRGTGLARGYGGKNRRPGRPYTIEVIWRGGDWHDFGSDYADEVWALDDMATLEKRGALGTRLLKDGVVIFTPTPRARGGKGRSLRLARTPKGYAVKKRHGVYTGRRYDAVAPGSHLLGSYETRAEAVGQAAEHARQRQAQDQLVARRGARGERTGAGGLAGWSPWRVNSRVAFGGEPLGWERHHGTGRGALRAEITYRGRDQFYVKVWQAEGPQGGVRYLYEGIVKAADGAAAKRDVDSWLRAAQRRGGKMRFDPAQLKKGVAEELEEHATTLKKIQRNPRMPLKQAAALIAKDHLKKHPKQYDRLEAVEVPKRGKGLKPPRLKLLHRSGKVRVYLIDSHAVRKIHGDWTMGGHHRVYPDFIPPYEVWIAEEVFDPERKLCTIHELNEYTLMGGGMGYDEAHDRSTALEQSFRKHGMKGVDAKLRQLLAAAARS